MEDLEKSAKEAWPIEACALLSGVWEEDRISVKRIFRTRNAHNSPISFQLDPVELVRCYSEAEAAGEEIVGVFHSHPAPPAPSSTDLTFMRLNPVVWLIMSMPIGAIGGYLWKEGEAVKVEIRVSA